MASVCESVSIADQLAQRVLGRQARFDEAGRMADGSRIVPAHGRSIPGDWIKSRAVRDQVATGQGSGGRVRSCPAKTAGANLAVQFSKVLGGIAAPASLTEALSRKG